MNYTIYCASEIIGEASSISKDEGMNVRLGQFLPSPAFEEVRHIFQLFVDAQPAKANEPVDDEKLQVYYEARGRLELKAVGDDGTVLPTSAIHIEIIEEHSPTVYEIVLFPPQKS